jgi:hypothetical protein
MESRPEVVKYLLTDMVYLDTRERQAMAAVTDIELAIGCAVALKNESRP